MLLSSALNHVAAAQRIKYADTIQEDGRLDKGDVFLFFFYVKR